MRALPVLVCTGWLLSGAGSGITLSQSAYSPLSGLRDHGVFGLYFNEDRVASIEFRLEPNGSFLNHAILTVGGQTVTTVVEIHPPGPGGIQIQSREYKQRVEAGAVPPGEPIRVAGGRVSMEPPAFFDGDYAAALLSSAVRNYDRTKDGPQTFPVYIVSGFPGVANGMPRGKQSASLEWIGREERTLGEFDRYAYTLSSGDYTVLAGVDHRIFLVESADRKVAYIREGYEALRQPETADPLVSQPSHSVQIDRGVRIRMRDGVELSADLYRPDTKGRFPVVLQRTPYKKEMLELQARYYARRGYVFAAQDVRGRFGSQGEWEPFVNEGKDGYDTIEWLAKQPWSSGKVGMAGASYDAITQWYAAVEKPPHLETIIPNVSPPDPYLNVAYEYGVFHMSLAMWWAEVLARNATADLSGQALYAARRNFARELRQLPVIELDEQVLGERSPMWRKWIAHPNHDAYWDRTAFLAKLKRLRLPVFHQSGWFDGDGIGTKLNYLAMAAAGKAPQKLVIGPWGHTDEAHRRTGPVDFGSEAAVPLRQSYLRWFDYWLKGTQNNLLSEPRVSLFVMGENRWRHADRYPLPGTVPQKWYLRSGRLTTEAPTRQCAPAAYSYDPGDPSLLPETFGRHVHPPIRKDKAVFLSEPFQETATFAGPLSAVLYASTSGRDTDWFVSLFDVDAGGLSTMIGQGKIRARFRNSLRKPKLLEPGRTYQYRLDLWHTAVAVKAGHRLKVEVASAWFPEFSRNLNTGEHNETETRFVTAQQQIHCSEMQASHVVLPLIPNSRARRMGM